MAVTLIAYRGRNDNGNETTATYKAAQNTPWVQAKDTNFRVRLLHQNDASGAINNLDIQLQYNQNGAGWNNVTAASTVVRASASPNLADAANLTTQLTGGTGTFQGATGFDEANGICGGNSMDVANSGHFETEFCVQVRSADVVDGDVIELRTINSDTASPWGTYNVVAKLFVTLVKQDGADTAGLSEALRLGARKVAGESVGLSESLDAQFQAAVAVIGITADGYQVFNNGVDALGRKVVDATHHFLDDGTIYFVPAGGATEFTEDVDDTLSASEALTKLAARNIAESVGLTEDETFQVQKTLAENISLSENLATAVTRVKALSDDLTLTESLRRDVSVNLADAVGLSEALLKRVDKRMAETLGLTESLAKLVDRALAENLSLFEADLIAAQRALSEDLSLTENLTAAVVKVKALAESVAFTEALSRETTIAPDDFVVLSESLTKSVLKAAAETVGLTEDLAPETAGQHSEDETLSLAESLAKVTGKTLAESVALAEEIVLRPEKNFAESLGLTETLDTLALKAQSVGDQISLAETIQKTVNRSAAESLLITEQVFKTAGKPFLETLGLTENLLALVIKLQSVQDTITLTESLGRQVIKSVSETVALTEDNVHDVSRAFSEALGLTEQLALRMLRLFQDTVTFTELLETEVFSNLFIADVIFTCEIARSIAAEADLNGSIVMGADLNRSVSLEVSLYG